MLPPGSARAIDVHLQIVGPDLDVRLVLDFGDDFDEGKRGMAPVRLVEGRKADEPVYPALRPKPSEGTLSRNAQGDALVAGFLARRLVEDLGRHLVALRPAQIHPQEHLRPVLGVGPSGAGMDADQRRVLGIGVGEQQIDFLLLEVVVERLQILVERALEMPVLFVDGHLGQADDITGAGFELPPDTNLIAQTFGLLREPLSPLGLLPDVRVF